MRIASFCFDDGFAASARTIRRLFDARGVKACFCVLSAPELTQDAAILSAEVAGWDTWREAVADGHEVSPHSHAHEFYGRMEPDAARASIESCFAVFERELEGFSSHRSVFHLPYLQAPPDLMDWLSHRTLGVRAATPGHGLCDPARLVRGGAVGCMAYGPDGVAEGWTRRLDRFSAQDGWLNLVFHGVDGEGWGPVARDDLARLLDRTLKICDRVDTPNRVLDDALRRPADLI